MNIPNTLTLVRIATTPVFIIFFMINTAWSIFACILLFGLYELTDFLDGNLARRYNWVTDFGKLMDPFADSICRFTMFLCFLSAGLAPIWLIAIFFYRDVLVSIVRVFAIRENVVVAARQTGKYKAMAQGIASFGVLAILFFQKLTVLPEPLYLILGIRISTVLIFLAAIVTIWSAMDYWKGNKQVVMRAMQQNTAG